MKITPIAQGGQTLGNVEMTGSGTTSMKLERARAIARGEAPREAEPDPQAQRIQQNVKSLRMRTQRSTNRDDALVALEEPAPTEPAPVSTIPESNEEGAVEATQPLSPQFAALAKQKRALQLERADLDKQKAALAESQGKMPSDELIAKLKSDPLGVLQENGVTYDQLTEAILSGQSGISPEIQALKEEIRALKKGVDDTFISKEEQAEQSALTEMLYEAESLAKEGEDFEMIREQDAYEKVLRKIHSTYKTTGRVLDVREAMQSVEDDLLASAEKLARLNKVKSRLAPPAAEPLQPQQRTMRTLTARDTAAPVLDRRARALAAALGTKK